MKNINGLYIKKIEVDFGTEIVSFEIQKGAYSLEWLGEEYLVEGFYYTDRKLFVNYEGESVVLGEKKIIDELEETEIDTRMLFQIGETYLKILEK